ncbi:hypothetical protein [Kitasatospora sp. CB01950]|nr:hypothetical protein [Kitasatospora sp. CB01950]
MADEQTNNEGAAPKKDGVFNAQEVTIEGEEHIIIREDEITGVVEH